MAVIFWIVLKPLCIMKPISVLALHHTFCAVMFEWSRTKIYFSIYKGHFEAFEASRNFLLSMTRPSSKSRLLPAVYETRCSTSVSLCFLGSGHYIHCVFVKFKAICVGIFCGRARAFDKGDPRIFSFWYFQSPAQLLAVWLTSRAARGSL